MQNLDRHLEWVFFVKAVNSLKQLAVFMESSVLYVCVLNTFLLMSHLCCFNVSFLYVYYIRFFVLCYWFKVIYTYVIAFSLPYILLAKINCLLIINNLIK